MRLIDQPLPGLEHVTEALQIERDFAGAWHVWISSAGRWWATRRGRDARWGQRHAADDRGRRRTAG